MQNTSELWAFYLTTTPLGVLISQLLLCHNIYKAIVLSSEQDKNKLGSLGCQQTSSTSPSWNVNVLKLSFYMSHK